MRMLVYEFASGGGLAGRHLPESLAREGAAMRRALLEDLVAIGVHDIVTTADERRARDRQSGVDVVTLPDGDEAREAALDRLFDGVDAVWLIAPETERCLERLAARAERKKKRLLGSDSVTIERASSKASLARLFAERGIRHPATRVIESDLDVERAVERFEFPFVVKPSRGAGSDGVSLVRDCADLQPAIRAARDTAGAEPIVMQEYVRGIAVSVSLLANGTDVAALTLNTQEFGPSPPFSYRGGLTPFEHPLAGSAIGTAVDACRVLPGLRGLVGVDLVLDGAGAVVIEINPRLTTSYLGVRGAVDENVAALALAACAGELPTAPLGLRRRVSFNTSGRAHVLPTELAS
jgi:tyramine---L-glutamate ligase